MAVTRVLADDLKAVSEWSQILRHEIPKATPIGNLIGTSQESIIQQITDTNKGYGDNVTFHLMLTPHGMGVSEGETAVGNSEALTFLTDKLMINELVHSIRVDNKGSISQQRTKINLRAQCAIGLKRWFADRMSHMFFIQAAGYDAKTIIMNGRDPIDMTPKIYGYNKPLPPSDMRIIRPDNKTKDEELTDFAKHKMTLALINEAVTRARTANPQIAPVNVEGSELYVMYLHPNQVHQLRSDVGANQWIDIMKHSYGGLPKSNPIFKGALGIYNGVVLREAAHVSMGVHSTNKTPEKDVRRAVLLGAQSVVIAYGRGGGVNTYNLKEEQFDYERQYSLALKTIFGMKKTRYSLTGDPTNAQDFGVITVATSSKLK